MQSVKHIFAALPRRASSLEGLEADRIPSRPNDYVALGTEGQPVLLVAFSGSEVYKTPIRLRHFSVDFGSTCRVRNAAGESFESKFVVITCSAGDVELYDFFLGVVESLLIDLPVLPETSDVQRSVMSLVELFRKLEVPSHRAIKGLWAELFVVYKSPSVGLWLAAWRGGVTDKFDFAWNQSRMDVKVTEGPRRIHEFALAQVDELAHATFVTSLLLRRSSSGLNVIELAMRIAERVTTNKRNLIQKLWTNVSDTLGADFAINSDLKFDPTFAANNLRVVAAKLIPKPDVLDSRVYDVRFKVDISEIADQTILVLGDCSSCA
ncbi:MAG: PD-(D/E)XK motif protein [Luteimonas sp.]